MDRQEYLSRWSDLHGGASNAGLVGVWLRLAYALARPLARIGTGPNTVTVAGLLVALAAVPVAASGGRWLLLAARHPSARTPLRYGP